MYHIVLVDWKLKRADNHAGEPNLSLKNRSALVFSKPFRCFWRKLGWSSEWGYGREIGHIGPKLMIQSFAARWNLWCDQTQQQWSFLSDFFFSALWKKRIVVVSRIWNLFSLSRARINQLRFLLHHSMVLTRQGLKYLFLDALNLRKRTKGNHKAPNKAWHTWPWHQFSDYFSSCFGNWFITDHCNLCNWISRERVF